MDAHNDPTLEQARAALESYLARVEKGAEPLDFEAFCARNPGLAPRLRELWAARPQPETAFRGEGAAHKSLLEWIRSIQPDPGRYRIEERIGQGGMGVVYRVWDGMLRRTLAKKVLRDPKDPARVEGATWVSRFLEEAQITAQLEHPGIVPVHELGVDEQGRVFFTMRLVRGEDFRRILAKLAKGEQGWNRTRALHVMLKVCETVAFAHAHGVVHRDLTPGNVMVGRFGEVYVMDWGLAQVQGRREQELTEEQRRQAAAVTSMVRTLRSEAKREESSGEVLYTLEGDVIGTPPYFAPEQARGDPTQVGPWTDVYAVGAMLYHLLAGRKPYARDNGEHLSPASLWHLVLAGPPEPLERVRADVPAELAAICAKAMAREVGLRYADMQALASDLRAYLENRVVQAHRTGALVELSKWVRRNRGIAAASAALFLVLLGSAAAIGWTEHQRRAELADRNAERLAADALALAPRLHPHDAARRAEIVRWVAEVEDLLAELPGLRSRLEAFEARHADAPREEPADDIAWKHLQGTRDHLVTQRDQYRLSIECMQGKPAVGLNEDTRAYDLAHVAENLLVLESKLPLVERELALAERRLARPRWRFIDAGLAREHARLRQRVWTLEELGEGGALAQVQARLATPGLEPAEHAQAWQRALASIAARVECPLYEGLRLPPQEGLVPLRRDPRSGLWEFWHVVSGERPREGADGHWEITAQTGIVLILVPAGTVTLGTQTADPRAPRYFQPAEGEEGLDAEEQFLDPHVAVEAYFLSKYELTQGQWQRLAGWNCSAHYAGKADREGARISAVHPVESVSWNDCASVLESAGLLLPSEAQWERAARADADFKFVTGNELSSLEKAANYYNHDALGPDSARAHHKDGFVIHAPVSTFPPNAWGFHDLGGNVQEWCRDWATSVTEQGRTFARDGERLPAFSVRKVIRDAGYDWAPGLDFRRTPRISRRTLASPDLIEASLGVRPARPVRFQSPQSP